MLTHLARILITAPKSGSGKTTLTCALMGALRQRGLRVLACKCGPDYVDPTFHERLGAAGRVNLDPFFQPEALMRDLLAYEGRGCDIACIEGAMGFYDGICATVQASAWDVARITQTPAVLALDARGAAASLAAQVLGFVAMRTPSHIAGVVLCHASARLADMVAPAIERECGVPVLGHLPHDDSVTLPSRHLGLVLAQDLPDLDDKLERLAELGRECLDVDRIVALAQGAPDIRHESAWPPPACVGQAGRQTGKGAQTAGAREAPAGTPENAPVPVIAVARDEAFCFYYAEELKLLEALGAKLAFFSPLHDARLPEGAQGLLLGGGYPELHAKELSENAPMLESVRAAVAAGMPAVAECGGFLYLLESLTDDAGQTWPLVGACKGGAARKTHGRFGYIELVTRTAGLLGPAGTVLRGHEFHHWEADEPGRDLEAQKPASERAWGAGHHTRSLYAGFPHLYLPANPDVARRFVRACALWGAGAAAHDRPTGTAAQATAEGRRAQACAPTS